MSESAMLIWAFALFAVLLNGCAAGIAALLHARRLVRRGGKIVGGIVGTGLVTTGMFVPFMLNDLATNSDGPMVMVLALLSILVVAMVVSLPGALIVTRRLEAPGDEFRTFE